VAGRVLTLRVLNRATLARQLPLERLRLPPAAVIERLVGMQAQWPSSPYLGIWMRATSFRCETLERELTRGLVVKATVMRQTLHLLADTWRLERGRVTLEPFAPLPRSAQRELKDEAAMLEAFLAA